MTASSRASTIDSPRLAWYSRLADPEPVFDPHALKVAPAWGSSR